MAHFVVYYEHSDVPRRVFSVQLIRYLRQEAIDSFPAIAGSNNYKYLACEETSDCRPGDSAHNAVRVAALTGKLESDAPQVVPQAVAVAVGPRKPIPAIPLEVWAERRDVDYMAATRALCAGGTS